MLILTRKILAKRWPLLRVFAASVYREKIASHPDNIFTSATLEGALNETYNRMIVSLCGPNSNIPTLSTPGEF